MPRIGSALALASLLVGCSSSSSRVAVGPDGGGTKMMSGGGGSGGGGSDGGGPPTIPAPPMPLISRGVPAFSSGNANTSTGPEKAEGRDPSQAWASDTLPAWLAYDLSAVPAAQRQRVLVAWYCNHAA